MLQILMDKMMVTIIRNPTWPIANQADMHSTYTTIVIAPNDTGSTSQYDRDVVMYICG